MPAIIEGPPEAGEPRPSLRSRLAWFIALALGAGGATAMVAYALKALLPS